MITPPLHREPYNTHITQNIGRFAPSPTGQLHVGSLTTAIASYCHIKSLPSTLHNKWLVRIEDVDIQRCKPEFSDAILRDLTNLGLHWDDSVMYQSQRSKLYNDYINHALKPYVYPCQCSRKQLGGARIYPQHCLAMPLTEQADKDFHKLRIQLPDTNMSFVDGVQGLQQQNPQSTLGDMVIRRDRNSLHMINYILAASIDDGEQNITHVTRGLDILPMTCAQMSIMQMAGFTAIEHWAHLPLITNQHGQKLSKQNLAEPIDTSSVDKCRVLIQTALEMLKQAPVDIDTPERMLAQAVHQWSLQPLHDMTTICETAYI